MLRDEEVRQKLGGCLQIECLIAESALGREVTRHAVGEVITRLWKVRRLGDGLSEDVRLFLASSPERHYLMTGELGGCGQAVSIAARVDQKLFGRQGGAGRG